MPASMRGLGVLRFLADDDFLDETAYLCESPDGDASVAVRLEPADEPPARRVEKSAEEMQRVYDDAQITSLGTLTTGMGPAAVLQAKVLSNVEVGVAAVELASALVYLTATAEAPLLLDFPMIVESMRPLGAPLPSSPPTVGWAALGPISALVPIGWRQPSVARFVFRSAVIEVHSTGSPNPVPASPQEMLPLSAEEQAVVDSTEPPAEVVQGGVRLATVVSAWTVRNRAGTPSDAVMMRALTATLEEDGRPLARVVGAARAPEWGFWNQLVASLRVASS
jgi:hypothetical protein